MSVATRGRTLELSPSKSRKLLSWMAAFAVLRAGRHGWRQPAAKQPIGLRQAHFRSRLWIVIPRKTGVSQQLATDPTRLRFRAEAELPEEFRPLRNIDAILPIKDKPRGAGRVATIAAPLRIDDGCSLYFERSQGQLSDDPSPQTTQMLWQCGHLETGE